LKKSFFIFILLSFVFLQSGCALLEVPGKVIGGTFDLLGDLFKLAEKLPMPPPGVFGN